MFKPVTSNWLTTEAKPQAEPNRSSESFQLLATSSASVKDTAGSFSAKKYGNTADGEQAQKFEDVFHYSLLESLGLISKAFFKSLVVFESITLFRIHTHTLRSYLFATDIWRN